ncbi:hypothetical protein I305_04910 [Cryptococcus gattii E566]|nr:hypothetical protein I305_04910 [Cryptococcus gattii E566]KJE01856.1 hypothetical protein I311_04494 [Cryptococcus gattii NT-10]
MSNLYRYDEDEDDPFLKGIVNMALSDDEPCLFPQKPESQVLFNLASVPSSHRLKAPTTTRQSISIPQQQTGSTQCYWIQPSSVTTPPGHWTSTYRQTRLPSNVNVNVNIDISINTTIENSNTWMSSSQSLASPIQARVIGTYDLLSHHSPMPSIPPNNVSWHTNSHWQDGPTSIPTFGSRLYDLLTFPTTFEDTTAVYQTDKASTTPTVAPILRSREAAIRHGEGASTATTAITAAKSKFSPLAALFIPSGQNKYNQEMVEEEEEDEVTSFFAHICNSLSD